MPSPKSRPRKWITIPEAAEHIGIHPRTLERMITAGELPGYKIGKKIVRVDLNEIDAAIAGRPL